jgi:hypothetical protein
MRQPIQGRAAHQHGLARKAPLLRFGVAMSPNLGVAVGSSAGAPTTLSRVEPLIGGLSELVYGIFDFFHRLLNIGGRFGEFV